MLHISQGRILEAQWCPSPNYNQRPQSPAGAVSLLVLHNISLPPGQFGGGYVQQFFQNQLDAQAHPYFTEIADLQVSSHLFIERDGTLTQFVNLNDRAWHAGQSNYQERSNCNDFSVGIELEGTDELPYTDKQYERLLEIVRALMAEYPQITPYRITGHEHIAPGRKTDPGTAFDWQRFFSRLRQE